MSVRLAVIIAALAALGIASAASSSLAMNGGNAVAHRFAGVKTVYWHGIEIGVWSEPGRGVHAYKVTYPAGFTGPTSLSEGWHFCENAVGYAPSLEACMGLPAQ